MVTEICRIIEDYNEVYTISTEGVVRNIKRGWIVKPRLRKMGYYEIGLSKDKKQIKYFVHRLVAKAFIGTPSDDKLIVNHKNGIKTDNRVENLEWCTRVENTLHSMSMSDKIPSAKLTKEQVCEIRELLKTKLPMRQIGVKYGVSRSTVLNIKNNKSWRF